MTISIMKMLIGLSSSAIVCLAAWRCRALTVSGAAAAFVVGALIMGLGGLAFAVPLIVFFVTSSAWSRWRTGNQRAAEKHGRNASQVIGNGGVAALIAVAAALTPAHMLPTTRDWFLLYVASLAFANADTWATEIGSKLSRSARRISDWARVTSGTSGAVSLPGSLAALAGSLVVAASAAAVWPTAAFALQWPMDWAEALAVTWAGFVGSLVDSLLGATVQAEYRCAKCGKHTEAVTHCDMPTLKLRGLRWFGNGAVNFAGSLAAVLAAWYLLQSFAWPI